MGCEVTDRAAWARLVMAGSGEAPYPFKHTLSAGHEAMLTVGWPGVNHQSPCLPVPSMSLAKCVRFHLGPHPPPLTEAMDCSGDSVENLVTHTGGVGAFTPPLPLHPTEMGFACSLGSGEAGELDDGSADNSLATPSPLHVHAFELPREWHDVYCTLGAIPLDHGRPRTDTHRQIIPGCVSFAACVDLSRVYAHKVDIDAIEATASTLLADGKGIDHAVMSQHMLAIQSQAWARRCHNFLSGPTQQHSTHGHNMFYSRY